MNDTLVYIMTAAIAVAAAAILLQTIILIAMFRASRAMRSQITPLIGKMEPVIEGAGEIIERVRKEIGEVISTTNEILDLSRKQLVRVDDILGEASERTRAQMARVEMVLDDTASRLQETTALLQDGLLRPLKQLNGLAVGLRAAWRALFGRHRTTVEQATHDEEMFI